MHIEFCCKSHGCPKLCVRMPALSLKLSKCATLWTTRHVSTSAASSQCAVWLVGFLCSLGSQPRDKPLFDLVVVRVTVGKVTSRAIPRVHEREPCFPVAACVRCRSVYACVCMRVERHCWVVSYIGGSACWYKECRDISFLIGHHVQMILTICFFNPIPASAHSRHPCLTLG